jgi:Protein tyrosine and serine/threonine kinase
MEYCIQTLEDFIRDIAKESQGGAKRRNDLAILNAGAMAEMDILDRHSPVEKQIATMEDNTPNHLPYPIEISNEQAFSAISPTLDDSTITPQLLSEPTFPEDDLIDWEALITVMTDITSGLIYIHSQKFVHRDLKPRNGTPFDFISNFM